jgi:hypothetical protein
MKSLLVFILPTLLSVSLAASQDGPYQPEGKIPEGFTFKKCAEDDEECLNKRTSFMSQYANYTKATKVRTTVVSITSDLEMTIVQDKVGKEIHITLKDTSRD